MWIKYTIYALDKEEFYRNFWFYSAFMQYLHAFCVINITFVNMKNLKYGAGLLLILIVFLSACGGPKKCGGGRGTKVEMGTM